MSKVNIDSEMIGHVPVLIVSPVGREKENLPLIVFYHGWQINKKLVLTQGRKLALAGFRAVLPDAQNHGSLFQPSSDIPSMTFFNSIHTNLFEFSFIVNHIRHTFGEPPFIGVGGLSMGGMTTAALLTHHPEIDAAAILMGSANLTDYRNRIMMHVEQSDFWLPDDYLDLTNWIPKYDLSKQPETVGDRPLFIWHGRFDEKVPFGHIASFVENNPQLNMEVSFQDRGHLVEIDTMNNVTDFFVKHYQNH